MMLAARPARSFVGVLHFALLCLASGACAQEPAPIAKSTGNTVLQLPSRLLGVWAPFSRNYETNGELRLTAETLSWSNCLYEEYRVLDANDQTNTYVIELTQSSPCSIAATSPLLMFESSDRALKVSDRAVEVSMCKEQAQLERPPGRRSCAWGILLKKD